MYNVARKDGPWRMHKSQRRRFLPLFWACASRFQKKTHKTVEKYTLEEVRNFRGVESFNVS